MNCIFGRMKDKSEHPSQPQANQFLFYLGAMSLIIRRQKNQDAIETKWLLLGCWSLLFAVKTASPSIYPGSQQTGSFLTWDPRSQRKRDSKIKNTALMMKKQILHSSNYFISPRCGQEGLGQTSIPSPSTHKKTSLPDIHIRKASQSNKPKNTAHCQMKKKKQSLLV